MKRLLFLSVLVLALTGCSSTNTITGKVLENKSVVTQQGIEYRAKIAVVDKLGHENWIWVTIPAKDAKVLPLNSTLIVDLGAEGYHIIN